jgi:hypothetical protein
MVYLAIRERPTAPQNCHSQFTRLPPAAALVSQGLHTPRSQQKSKHLFHVWFGSSEQGFSSRPYNGPQEDACESKRHP